MAQVYNPTEIKSKANQMKEESARLKNLIDQMSGVVDSLGGVWQSPAQSKFASKFHDLEPKLLSFCGSINQFGERAIAHAESVEAVEVV